MRRAIRKEERALEPGEVKASDKDDEKNAGSESDDVSIGVELCVCVMDDARQRRQGVCAPECQGNPDIIRIIRETAKILLFEPIP